MLRPELYDAARLAMERRSVDVVGIGEAPDGLYQSVTSRYTVSSDSDGVVASRFGPARGSVRAGFSYFHGAAALLVTLVNERQHLVIVEHRDGLSYPLLRTTALKR